MRRFTLFFGVVLCLATAARAQTSETIVPAGTLIQCTLNEPRLSSETARTGDPILCHVSSLGMFGRPVFPRGAYLSGRLVEYRDPGHFLGKGWLQLEFESLTLPGGSLPVSAKVISVPHYQVDAAGKIHGKGHARRDVVEWSIPILWPEKLITLPMRGPRPTLKGESRVLLKLMEDLSIPESSAVNSSAARSAPDFRRSMGSNQGSSWAGGPSPRLKYGGASRPAEDAEPPFASYRSETEKASFHGSDQLPQERPPRPRPTLLIFKNGDARLVASYWFEPNRLVFIDNEGAEQALPLGDLDLRSSMQINWERHVPFVLRSGP